MTAAVSVPHPHMLILRLGCGSMADRGGMLHFQAASFDGKTIDGKMWTDKGDTGRGWTAHASFKVKVPPKK